MSPACLEPTGESESSAEAQAWRLPSPTAEARVLFGLVGRNGDTVETIRELITVPEETEAALQAFVRAYPEEQGNIERVLRFRREVQAEFERLTGNARQ